MNWNWITEIEGHLPLAQFLKWKNGRQGDRLLTKAGYLPMIAADSSACALTEFAGQLARTDPLWLSQWLDGHRAHAAAGVVTGQLASQLAEADPGAGPQWNRLVADRNRQADIGAAASQALLKNGFSETEINALFGKVKPLPP